MVFYAIAAEACNLAWLLECGCYRVGPPGDRGQATESCIGSPDNCRDMRLNWVFQVKAEPRKFKFIRQYWLDSVEISW